MIPNAPSAGPSPAASRSTPASPAAAARRARLTRVRRASLAVLVLIVAEYVLGMYVNLYVAVPAADARHGLGTAISAGPALLTAHAVLGLALTLGALAVLVHAILARSPAVIAVAAAGLIALALAASAGSSFTAAGKPADSMAMSVLTGVALLCYAVSSYLRPHQGG
jgi:hypothetical protein